MAAAVTGDRPKLIAVIAGWYGLLTIYGIFGLLAKYSGSRPTGGDPHKFVNSIPPDYLVTWFHLLDLIVMSIAAILLFRLRKSAVEFCGITFMLKVFVLILPAIRGDLARMGFSDWAILTGLITLGMLYVTPSLVIFVYARTLREKGILT